MKTEDIRRKFLDFFVDKGHEEVASSSLVPHNDPTLLFTNAGMNQFKDLFLGLETRAYNRAVTSQKCVRAGGKHNDLENVGYTARHHTFFEMLGNFSFGDYFKEKGITYAWELLTKVYGLSPEKLLVTVYHTDDEAYDIWHKKIGIPEEKIIRIGDLADGSSDNFWQMGDTGPCGPCSEIFYDHGEHIWGGPPGSPDEDGDRFIEIWNLVFMQFNRDEKGKLHPLPNPSIDTGMGLERIAAVLQNVHSNYEIDLFVRLINAAADAVGTSDLEESSLKVISDHIRSVAFLIADGVIPSNEGRGYVLRRIIRRAIRHGYKLGQKNPFFYTLVTPLTKEMGGAFPELKEKEAFIITTIKEEEKRFATTLDHGLKLLEEDLNALRDSKQTVIPGETVFKLYDTYGFPVDLTNDIAREQNLTLDTAGFEHCMAEQRTRARAASQFNREATLELKGEATTFEGYTKTEENSAQIIALFTKGDEVDSLSSQEEEGIIVLNKTPFYAEAGGQIGDTGVICHDHFEFLVTDTQKQQDATLHYGIIKQGSISVGEQVQAKIDSSRRELIKKNHSATHLLHKVLKDRLGSHVEQKGSLVADDRLRFDFSHSGALTFNELEVITRKVNQAIMANHPIRIEEMPLDQAKKDGAEALFGEKYGEVVRTIRMGDSFELCGGTHVETTGDIGAFRIISETGIAAGIRRIEAITYEKAYSYHEEEVVTLHQLGELLNTDRTHIKNRVEELLNEAKQLRKENNQLKSSLVLSNRDSLLDKTFQLQNTNVIIETIEGADNRSLKELADYLQDKINGAVLLLSPLEGERVALVASVAKALSQTIKAGDLLNSAATVVGGKGGGRPTSASGGGSLPAHIPQAMEAAKTWLVNQLN